MMAPSYLALIPEVLSFSRVVNATTTTNLGLCCGYERISFYAQGRSWQFWVNSTTKLNSPFGSGTGTIEYATSIDGQSWSGDTVIGYTLDGGSFSVWFDGDSVQYIRGAPAPRLPHELFYRKGIPNSGGSISWVAAEQDIGVAGITQKITVDYSGHPWIGYTSDDANRFLTAIKDEYANGTWRTAPGFPHTVSTTYSGADANGTAANLISLTHDRMYVLYQKPGKQVLGTPYNGTNWGSEETASTSSVYPNDGKDYESSVAIGDVIHHVFLNEAGTALLAVSRSDKGVWSPETKVVSLSSPTFPIVSYDDKGLLYVFYMNNPTHNHLYYTRSSSPDSTALWDTPVDWIKDEASTLPFSYGITAFDHAGGGVIGVAFIDGATSPYNIEFQALPEDILTVTIPYNGIILAVASIGVSIVAIAFSRKRTKRLP